MLEESAQENVRKSDIENVHICDMPVLAYLHCKTDGQGYPPNPTYRCPHAAPTLLQPSNHAAYSLLNPQGITSRQAATKNPILRLNRTRLQRQILK